MQSARKQRGITLIETLVALAIMGLTTAAILVLIGQSTRFAAQARERTYASIAADNLMVEALTLSGPVETGVAEGDVSAGDREWRYRKIVTETGVDALFRIDIDVVSDNGQVLASAQTLRKVQ